MAPSKDKQLRPECRSAQIGNGELDHADLIVHALDERKRAALTQADCAHMLGTDQPRISKFEAGKAMPSIVELSVLYLLFDRSLARASEEVVASRRDDLLGRLASIPDCPPTWRDRQTRFHTLGAVAEKLAAIDPEQYE